MMTIHELELMYNILKSNLKKTSKIDDNAFHEAWTSTIRKMGHTLCAERQNYGNEFS
jgi:hypothetical protein